MQAGGSVGLGLCPKGRPAAEEGREWVVPLLPHSLVPCVPQEAPEGLSGVQAGLPTLVSIHSYALSGSSGSPA